MGVNDQMAHALSPFTQLSLTIHGATDVVGTGWSGPLDLFAVVEHTRWHAKDDAAAACAPTVHGVTAARSGTRAPTWDESFGIPVSEFAAASLAHEFVVVSIFNVCPGRRHLVCEGPAGGV